MVQISSNRQQSAFSSWLRTGRLPSGPNADGIELKFNPWHDPANGRFTFAQSGQFAGRGEAGSADRAGRRAPATVYRAPAKRHIRTRADADAWRVEQLAKHGKKPKNRDAIEGRYKRYLAALESLPGNRPHPAVEFIGGVGQGLHDAAADTAKTAYSLLTTNPVTTVGDMGRGIAQTIDTAIAAEDIPARVQVSRAADAAANASARDVGHAVGSVAGNVALTVAPGAALGKVAALRRLRVARSGAGTFDPLQVGWVKENIVSSKAWKIYNDTATGARPGQAPALRRTMPDGSTRPVKFDGIEGDYVIDRKWSIRNMPRARAQAMRQSQALAEHHAIGLWELPNETERTVAVKMLKSLDITNIKVRVIKP